MKDENRLAQPLGNDWQEYRLLILSKLDDIRIEQINMRADIQAISNQNVEARLEIAANAARRGFIAAAIPTAFSFIIMLINFFRMDR